MNNMIIKQWIENVIDGCKVFFVSLINEKRSIPAIWKWIYTTVGYGSTMFSFAVLLKNMAGYAIAEELCKSNWWLVFVVGGIASLIHNHQKTTITGIIEKKDLFIKAKVCDLFAVKASSYVIPTNTFFRTIMDENYISPESVQGRFQLGYFYNNLEMLDQLIQRSLEQQGVEGENKTDIHGTVKQYPIGTVAKVDYKEKHFYFVAVCDVNKYGKPEEQKYQNVNIALNGLVDSINEFGHWDDVAMPLIGTGHAAIGEATIEKVFEDTIDLFVNSSKKIARNVIVCIRPKDYLEGRVDLKKIAKYIDYKCVFLMVLAT